MSAVLDPAPNVSLQVLREVFGYAAFRGPQQAIVQHAVAGGDALVLMPTGGGKSLCYQVPAIVRERAGHGVTVVVSPLIALMHDQVGALIEAGVSAAFLNSSLSMDEAQRVERQLRAGELTLLDVAPCVSQWGHDFRPEYRDLAVLPERFAGVPRIALTATADALTRADIVERLQLQAARTF